jgi:hypothetical protein
VNVELNYDECLGTMLYISLKGKPSFLHALLASSWKVKREVHGAAIFVAQQAWVGRVLLE